MINNKHSRNRQQCYKAMLYSSNQWYKKCYESLHSAKCKYNTLIRMFEHYHNNVPCNQSHPRSFATPSREFFLNQPNNRVQPSSNVSCYYYPLSLHTLLSIFLFSFLFTFLYFSFSVDALYVHRECIHFIYIYIYIDPL